MKRFKLSVALLSSGLMAYSPVTQASMSLQDKKDFNAHVREVTKLTYGDLISQYGPLLETTSQAQLDSWKEHFGNRKLPQVQAQMVKGKNGKENLKLVYNDMGQTLTMTIDPENTDSFDINGTKFALYELLDIPGVIKKMAETNKKMVGVVESLPTDRAPASQRTPIVTVDRFAQMKPIERVEVLSLMNQAAIAAQNVLTTVDVKPAEAKKTSQFILHPLIASQLAFAETKEGMTCVVAGYLSTYHPDKENSKHLACDPSSQQNDGANEACRKDAEATHSKGNWVACNPLVHGVRMDDKPGLPFCVNSSNQPDFTNYATKECNRMSPIDDPNAKTRQEKEAYRLKAYRRILSSYAFINMKGREKIEACFMPDNRIKSERFCETIFRDHVDKFNQLMGQAQGVCADAKQKTKDQPLACDELLSRKLVVETAVIGYGPIKTVDIGQQGDSCKKAGGTYGPEKPEGPGAVVCKCPDGSISKQNGNEFAKCPATAAPPVAPTVPVIEKSTWAKKEKKDDGLCSGGWMIGCLGLGILAIFGISKWFKKDPKPTTPVVTPPIVIPPPVIVTPAPNEGTTTQPGSPNNGGVRQQGTH